MKRLALFLFLCLGSMLRADTYTFDLLPAGGTISGNAGSTIGWGYSIGNLSADRWLVIMSLNSGAFVHATPNILFDYPILAPGGMAIQAFNRFLGLGLMELALDHSLPGIVINSGEFLVEAQWWDGDPFLGGSYVSDADSIRVAYRAVANPSAVPEPSEIALLGIALGGCLFGIRARSGRNSASGPDQSTATRA